MSKTTKTYIIRVCARRSSTSRNVSSQNWSRLFAAFLMIAFSTSSILGQEVFRTWTTADGKHSVEASYSGTQGNRVTLKTRDGKAVQVLTSQLSVEDNKYLAKIASSNAPQEAPIVNDVIARQSIAVGKKYGLPIINGLPTVHLDDFSDRLNQTSGGQRSQGYKNGQEKIGQEQKNLGRILELIALNSDPNWIAPYLPNFVINHFKKEIATQYIESSIMTSNMGVWKGENEFEKRASQQSFENKYKNQIPKLAIKTPLRFRFISKARLSEYDFLRNGLGIGSQDRSGSESVAGLEWIRVLPTFPSAGYHRKQIRVAFTPFGGTSFWPVDANTVKSLPSHSTSTIPGRGRSIRWAYVSTVVTLRNAPIFNLSSDDPPTLFGSVESVEIFSDPELKTRLHTFQLNTAPKAVLVDNSTQSTKELGQAIPLDELALAGLFHQNTAVHSSSWPRMFEHVARQDQADHELIDKQIQQLFTHRT